MEVIETIRAFLIKENMMDADMKIDETDSLLEEGIIDSLGIQALVAFLEETYDITVEEDDLMPDNFDTLEAIKDYVENKQENRS